MSVRIISGKYKGINLEVPVSARPTLSRNRQSLFDMLESMNLDDDDRLPGEFFKNKTAIDCFAGSGALGIEALSRGAGFVYFIENNRQAVITLRANLSKVGAQNAAQIICADALQLRKPKKIPPYDKGFSADLLFLDPPYEIIPVGRILMHLLKCGWISFNTLVIVEKSPKDKAKLDFLDIFKTKKSDNSEFLIARISLLTNF